MTRYFLSLILILFFTVSGVSQPDGEKLFKQHCTTCHTIGGGKMTGPDLEGVMGRIDNAGKDKQWLFKWIQNSQELKEAGDPYAAQLDKNFPAGDMNIFTFLKDEEINAIIGYLENPVTAKAADDIAVDTGDGASVVEKKDNTLPWILVGLSVILLVIISFLNSTKRSLNKALDKEDVKLEHFEPTIGQDVRMWINKNKILVAIVVIVLLIAGGADTYNAMMDVGVYEGYQPEQPIAFSHRLHAGENGIQCVYCHVGARKGKVAMIPSPNICMNCHKAIKQGPGGSDEIAKIYKAIGFDPDKNEYIKDYEQEPIEWTRVHNLPDHVYFNHSQHYVVGGVECQTCHGPIDKEMTVAKQHSPLTMGWCVDCHRTRGVMAEGNGYYEEIHARLRGRYEMDGEITVAKLGGLECAKCHY